MPKLGTIDHHETLKDHCASFVVLFVLVLFCWLQVMNFVLFSSWL